jgi:carboxyl-terminal processing protease
VGKAEHIPDSLIREFKTKTGRSVYDGSGIFPDIKLEPRTYALITGTLAQKNYFFDYATKYRFAHNSIAQSKEFSMTEDEYKDFLQYISDKDYKYTTKSEKSLEDFKKNTESEKYFESIKTSYEDLKSKIEANKKEDLAKYKPEIKDILEEEIASRYYYQRGRLESALKDDNELKEAIKVLNDKQLYESILAGKGQYKLIGKPGETTAKVNLPEDDNEDIVTPDDAPKDSKDIKKQDIKKQEDKKTPKKKGG